MGVVDQQRQRPGLGQIRDQPVQAVEDHRRAIALGGSAGTAVEHGRREPGGALEHARTGGPQLRPQELADGGERGLHHELVAADEQRGHPALARRLGARVEQRGLSDPGRALDEHDRAASLAHPVEQLAQRIDLSAALEQACRHPRVPVHTEPIIRPHSSDVYARQLRAVLDGRGA